MLSMKQAHNGNEERVRNRKDKGHTEKTNGQLTAWVGLRLKPYG